jgi:hypothetical protein
MHVTATIALGEATSDIIDIEGRKPTHLLMPAAFTGTAITFTACETKGGTFLPLEAAGSAISVTVAANKAVALGEAVKEQLEGLSYIKLVSNAAGAGYELAARSIGVVLC